MRRGLRTLFVLAAVAVCCTVGMWLVGLFVRPDLSERPPAESPADIRAAQDARNVHFDPEHTPDYYVHTHVAPQHESPILANLVRQAELPPLADRMPRNPVMIQGPDGVGNYGGTWMRLATNPTTEVDT